MRHAPPARPNLNRVFQHHHLCDVKHDYLRCQARLPALHLYNARAMSRDESNTLKTAEELRIELKTWEAAFLKANGRKAGREDIKKDAAISASSG